MSATKYGSGLPNGRTSLLGFTRVTGPTAVSPSTPSNPSGHVVEDTAGNAWYYWFDTNGVLRFADAATVEAAGFNFNTGGKVLNLEAISVPLLAASVDTD